MKQTKIFYKQFKEDGRSYVKIIKIKNVARLQDLPFVYRIGIPLYYKAEGRDCMTICTVDYHGFKRYFGEGDVLLLSSFAGLVLLMRNAGERLHKIIEEMNKIRMVRI